MTDVTVTAEVTEQPSETKKSKKEAKTRTSITINPGVLETLRVHCEKKQVSVSSYLEDLVRADLYPKDTAVDEV